MLRKRIIACVVVKDGWAVQSIDFKKFLPIGKPEIAIEYLSRWNIDEIVLVDISATKSNKQPDFGLLERVSKDCFVPLTFGGGMKSVDDVVYAIRNGAEKVSINAAVHLNPDLITKAATIVGSQSIVVSIDTLKVNGEYVVYDYVQNKITEIDLFEFAKRVSDLGAGEIFLNSVDRDGLKQGYDLNLLDKMSKCVEIPVIACGGVGNHTHFKECMEKTNISAMAAANIFHFSEHSVITLKSFLKKSFDQIRIEGDLNYLDFNFDSNSRVY